MKKKNLLVLPIMITCFLFGLFGMESSVYGKELNGESGVSIPVTGILTDGKTDEQNIDDKNTGEDISGNVATVIKDKSIQRLPTTGEKLSKFLLIVGMFLLVVVLGMKNKKIFVKNR
ncbi:LPXTG cell wall anchor domain-containing protein [Enterococcus faecalis]|nr:LPXTG cell wall anchor domain-containing protein [Enterococcus faecalis]